MVVAAALIQDPGSIIGWILVGLIAGALAGRITRGKGFGCLGDIVVGLIGSFIGGLIVSPFVHGTAVVHFIGTTLVALVGAVVLLLVLRLIFR